MPTGEGFWLNVATGKAIPVIEHLAYVTSYPTKFGLRRIEDRMGSREEILRRVLRNGWIRVRATGDSTVFEFDASRDDAMWSIKRFCKRTGIPGLYTTARINDVRTRTSVDVSGTDILTADDPAALLGFSLIAGKRGRPANLRG